MKRNQIANGRISTTRRMRSANTGVELVSPLTYLARSLIRRRPTISRGMAKSQNLSLGPSFLLNAVGYATPQINHLSAVNSGKPEDT